MISLWRQSHLPELITTLVSGTSAGGAMVPIAGDGYHWLDPTAKGNIDVLVGREPWLSASA
jgi:hypothetical protein